MYLPKHRPNFLPIFVIAMAFVLASLIATTSARATDRFIIDADELHEVHKALDGLNQCVDRQELLDRKVFAQELQIDALKSQLDNTQQIANIYKQTNESVVGLMEQQRKTCEMMIKDTKPSILDRLKEGALFIVFGLTLGAIGM